MGFLVAQASRLIRIVLLLLLIGAVVSAVSLVMEFVRFTSVMPSDGWNYPLLRLIGLVILNLLFASFFAVVLALYLWVRMAGSLPDLQGWHLEYPRSEFRAKGAIVDYTLDDYLRQEQRVYDELNTLKTRDWGKQNVGAFSRFRSDSVSNPETIVERNWNRTYVLKSEKPVGGVLLLHGLSDSPYSLRALGERLHREGYTVVWLRLPGHGTCPAALANVDSQDWIAAVKVAMRGLQAMLPKDTPLVLGGYSNGGALSVLYSTLAVSDASLPKPKAVMLFAPMIGISPLARITKLYHMVALVTNNKKAQWSGISAEIDPFRYSSWPMNASVQAWRVTQAVECQLAKLEKDGRIRQMPPIMAMQSVVDSTIIVPKLITALFDRLRTTDSELFLFDINREERILDLFNRSFEQKIFPKLERTDLPFTLTLLTNASATSSQVVLRTRCGKEFKEESLDLAWPQGILSLSHLAVPIPPEDPIYGTSEATKSSGLSLGTISTRTEPSALIVSSTLFFRCRNNPFYALMEQRIVDWLDQRLRK